MPTINCPICNAQVSDANQCGQCGVELTIYLRAYNRPWRQYNLAIDLAEERRFAPAARAAYAAVCMAPNSVEFRMLLSRLLAAGGELDEAISHAEAADDLRPDDDDIRGWLESLFKRKYQMTTESDAIEG